MRSDQELKFEPLLIVHNIWRKQPQLIVHNIWRKQPHLRSKALFLIEEKTKLHLITFSNQYDTILVDRRESMGKVWGNL